MYEAILERKRSDDGENNEEEEEEDEDEAAAEIVIGSLDPLDFWKKVSSLFIILKFLHITNL